MIQFRTVKTEEEKDFCAFVRRAGGYYYQLPGWQIFKSNWEKRLYAGFRDGEQVLSCLILERKIPLCGRLWYAPCGYVGDLTDEALMREFSAFIRNEMKRAGVFALVCDPMVPLRIDGERQAAAEPVIANFEKCGWQLNPDPNNFTYQPTMTVMVDTCDEAGVRYTPDTLRKKFEKGVRYSVRVGEGRGLRSLCFDYAAAQEDPALFDAFMDVMSDTADRLGIMLRTREYYYSFLKAFPEETLVDLVYYDKAADRAVNAERLAELARLREGIEGLNEAQRRKAETRIGELENERAAFEARYKEACGATDDERLYLAAGVTVTFGALSGCVFGGTKNVLRNTLRSSHYLNFIRIVRALENPAVRWHDLGRVPHYYLDENSPEHGLYLFKKSLGARLYEFIGEYALVNKKGRWFLYYKLMPFVRKYRMRLILKMKKILGKA